MLFSARYDLAYDIASFDFYSWLVQRVAEGASEIVFGTERVKTNKWSEFIVRKRFETIIRPGPALLGLPCRVGSDGVRRGSAHLIELVRFHRAGRKFPRLRSPMPSGHVRYTVTLRRDARIPSRNSNEAAWRIFAREIGALVIEDYDVAPISLHERMALYAGAEQNFGVPNGPMHLCVLADYPFMMFDCQDVEGGFVNAGIPKGGNYPWAGSNQMTIWEPDDIEVLRKHFAAWKANQCSA